MKRIFILLFIILLTLTVKAQQKLAYEYDAAGNREKRTIVLDTRSASVFENPADSIFSVKTQDDKRIRIYPNPVETQMTIRITDYATAVQGEYSLYSITGSMVAKRRITGETTLVDMGRHPRGIYILQIVLNGEPFARKVIKK